tara:strand:- start:3968 stop:4813 length:846 start_codon:yes stop_codon:yes gene_type:complete
MKHELFKYILVISIFYIGCASDDKGESEEPAIIHSSCTGSVIGAVTSGNNDVLVWADEFSTDGVPCSQNWTYDIGDNGWGNNESQYYTRKNVTAKDGILKITAKKETYLGAAYSSARIKTQDRFSFTYGRVEVRAKLPSGGGTWPAIWMLGDNITSVSWPSCGEIDIMEHTGNDQGITSSAIHNASGSGNTPYVGYAANNDAVSSAFHIYAINWTAEKIDFMVDDVIHYTYQPTDKNAANWPFDANQFIVLNVAMGGSLGGAIDGSFTESAMEIDYVRVFQ